MSKIDAVWVGPPADFTEPPKDYDSEGRPIFEIGEDEAVLSDHWKPVKTPSKKVLDRIHGDAEPDPDPATEPDPSDHPKGADA